MQRGARVLLRRCEASEDVSMSSHATAAIVCVVTMVTDAG